MNAPVLIIRPPSEEYPLTEWYCARQLHQVTDADALPQLKAQPGADNVCLLLPVQGLIWRQFSITSKKFSLTQQSIAWQLEESLIGDGEAFHWTVLHRQNEMVYVVGIARERLSAIVREYQLAGLYVTAVVPDGGYLPAIADGWSALRMNHHWLVRLADFQWSLMSDTVFCQLARHYTPNQIICYGEPPAEMSACRHDGRSPLSFYCQQFTTPPVNLLHGEFRARAPALPVAKIWQKCTAGIALFSILIFFINQSFTIWQQHTIQQQLKSELQANWQSYFPGDKRQGSWRFFFRQKVRQPAPEPLVHIRQLESLLRQTPDLQLVRFSGNKETGALQLTVFAKNPHSLNRFLTLSRDQLHLAQAQPASGNFYFLQSGGNR